MVHRLWIPALAALGLLLSACGDSQEESPITSEESTASVVDEDVAQGEEAPVAPEEIEDDVEARQAAAELEQAEALREENNAEAESAAVEDIQASDDTLAADPDDVLDETSAMPGETTRSDVDDVIAETERRFEEAQRRLDEQFEEVEQHSTPLEPMADDEFSPSWETESSLPESTRLEDDLETTDVDALIEDTERRFEEAQQRLNEQFEEIERERISREELSDVENAAEFNSGMGNNSVDIEPLETTR